MTTRKSKTKRDTKETSVSVSLNIDGSGKTSIDTGISFLDHLITSFGKHSMLDLTVKAKSKDKIEHHLIEDTAIAIGSTIDKALGIGQELLDLVMRLFLWMNHLQKHHLTWLNVRTARSLC